MITLPQKLVCKQVLLPELSCSDVDLLYLWTSVCCFKIWASKKTTKKRQVGIFSRLHQQKADLVELK